MEEVVQLAVGPPGNLGVTNCSTTWPKAIQSKKAKPERHPTTAPCQWKGYTIKHTMLKLRYSVNYLLTDFYTQSMVGLYCKTRDETVLFSQLIVNWLLHHHRMKLCHLVNLMLTEWSEKVTEW